jgi:hypothetical protein
MSNYPASLDDASSLYNPADAFSSKPLRSTLAVSCQADDTALQFADGVVNVGGPAAYGIVRIDDEQILYTAASAGNVTGCTRGFAGTTRVGHAQGTPVRWVYVAAFDQALQAAIIAVQTAVGITSAPNFAPTPGGERADRHDLHHPQQRPGQARHRLERFLAGVHASAGGGLLVVPLGLVLRHRESRRRNHDDHADDEHDRRRGLAGAHDEPRLPALLRRDELLHTAGSGRLEAGAAGMSLDPHRQPPITFRSSAARPAS